MPERRGRLRLNREQPLPDVGHAYWEVEGSAPSEESRFWLERFFHLMEAQPHIETMFASLAPGQEGTLSNEYASKLDDMVMLGSHDDGPGLELRQRQQMMCLYQDIGLVAKAFTVEVGMKALLSVCGQEIRRRHRLAQLFDALNPVARRQLTAVYPRAEKSFSLPNEILRVHSIHAILKTYDNLYTEIRYRSQLVDTGPILSAWFHLDIAAHTIGLALLTHKSNADMRYAYSMSID